MLKKKSKFAKRAFVVAVPLILLVLLVVVNALNNLPNKIDFYLHRRDLDHIIRAVKQSGLKPNGRNVWNLRDWDGTKSLTKLSSIDHDGPVIWDVHTRRIHESYMVTVVTKVEPYGFDCYGCYEVYGYVYADDFSEYIKSEIRLRGSLNKLEYAPINSNWLGVRSIKK